MTAGARGRAGVEVDAGVRRLGLAEGAQHVLQVADAHVVRDEGEVGPAELAPRDPQVARGRLERPGRVEPLVDGAAQRAQALDAQAAPLASRDLACEPCARADVDPHPEEVLPRLGQDLGQAGRALRVPRHRVGPPRALEEHEPLEQVGVHAGLAGGLLDGLPVARDPRRGRRRALGRARVEDVARAGGGAAHELVLLRGVVGERVGERRALRVTGDERLARRGAVPAQGDARHQGHQDEGAREQHDAGATDTGASSSHRHSPWQTDQRRSAGQPHDQRRSASSALHRPAVERRSNAARPLPRARMRADGSRARR